MVKKRPYVFFFGGLLLSLLAIGCASSNRQTILSFFFDGVPLPQADSINRNVVTPEIDFSTVTSTPISVDLVYAHKPYQERACDACHNPENMGELLLPEPDLCYQCHDDLHASNKVLHGPVDAGYCTQCHNPHSAKDSSLLRYQGKALCFSCHDGKLLDKNPLHKGIADNCLTCHNAHGGSDQLALKANSCSQCHAPFNNEYKVVHGPVAANLCQECHSSHSSKTKNKLIATGQSLCTRCHALALVLKNEMHEGIENADCTECHNPHGGEDRLMLY